jgi:signal transduction histidine kinase
MIDMAVPNATLHSTVATVGVPEVVGAVSADAAAVQALLGLALTAERLLEGPDDRARLEEALGVLGETLDFAGVGVWEHAPDRPGVYRVHARWRADPIPVPDELDVSVAGLDEVHAAVLAGRSAEVWRDSANPALRHMLDVYQDEGFLVVPVVGVAELWGVALYALRRDDRRPWTSQARTSLRTVAAMFGGAVRRRQEAERAERMRALLELSGREEGLATLAAGIAHDISNMLGVLRAGLDLAELRGKFIAQDAARMENAFDAAKALVDQLYAFAGVDAPPPVDVDLRRLLVRGEKLLLPRKPPNVQVHIHIADDVPTVRGHPTQVGQAIGNVVLNAVEATAQTGGTVRVSAQTARRHGRCGVAICIDDDGPGVPEELRAALFKPLVSTKGSRRGVGLASAASIARSHGGSLHLLETDAPGAHFELWLPTAEKDACSTETDESG